MTQVSRLRNSPNSNTYSEVVLAVTNNIAVCTLAQNDKYYKPTKLYFKFITSNYERKWQNNLFCNDYSIHRGHHFAED